MYRSLSISIDNIDGNVSVTTEVVEEGTHPTRPTYRQRNEEDSIISLLEPCLNDVWDPISRRVTPKHIVVKVIEINTACRELFCHFLDRDWPLIHIDISPFTYITGREALKMAASYYKRLDSATLPRFTQKLPEWLESSQFADAVNDLLRSNERYYLGHSIDLTLRSEDLKRLDCTDIAYLARRSSIAIAILCGNWEANDLARLIPHFRDLGVTSLYVDGPLSSSSIPLLIQIIWQNPKVTSLHLNRRSMLEFNIAPSKLGLTLESFKVEPQ